MRSKRKLVGGIPAISIVILIFLSACQHKEIRNLEDMAAWIYNVENGLQKSKQIGDLNLKVNYIPPAYHALREDPSNYNQIVEEYDQSLSFILSISAKEGQNILWRGIRDYKDYRSRVHHLNFELEQNISLRMGDVELHPVLTNVENLYEETDYLRINVIFSKEGLENMDESQLSLRFDDRIFKSGLNVFHFDNQHIQNIPTPILAS